MNGRGAILSPFVECWAVTKSIRTKLRMGTVVRSAGPTCSSKDNQSSRGSNNYQRYVDKGDLEDMFQNSS